jgi:hypothetical protein
MTQNLLFFSIYLDTLRLNLPVGDYPVTETRKCPRCKEELELTPENFSKNKRAKNGFQTYCRPCQSQIASASNKKRGKAFTDYQRDYQRKWREDNKERATRRRRVRYVRMKYGLTLGAYEELIQQPSCSICSVNFDSEILPCVDHCHDTGKIRGVLCNACNVGLGYFKDDVGSLQQAISYLRQNVDALN